jgi:hypothetical protein
MYVFLYLCTFLCAYVHFCEIQTHRMTDLTLKINETLAEVKLQTSIILLFALPLG